VRPPLDATSVLGPGRVAHRRLHDGALAVAGPEPGGEVVRIAGTGPALWRALDGQRPLGEVAHELAVRHRADPTVVLADVCTTAQRYLDLGVAELVPPGGATAP
jgi:hypothetical protein